MQILITGRHVGVTEAMKEYAREKAAKLERIHDRLTKVEVTLDAVRDSHRVEIVVDAPRGVRLVAKGESPDVYAAVDLAEEKIARQLVRHVERLHDHHHPRARESASGPAAAPPRGAPADGAARPGAEDTYDDVIEKLGEED